MIGEITVNGDGTASINKVNQGLVDMDGKAQSVQQTLPDLGAIFNNVFANIATQAINSAASALKSLADTGFKFLGDSIKSASDEQIGLVRLNKLVQNQFKDDAIAKLNAAQATGYYATVTAGSSKEIEKLKGQIESQNNAIGDQILRNQIAGKTSESAANNIKFHQAKIDQLNDSLTNATATHKVWVNTASQIPNIAHANMEEMTKWASALQDTTRFSDDSAIAAEGMLYKFDKIGKDIFPQALKSSADLAEMLGTDLPNASQLVGKALEDPAAGLTGLNRQLKLFDDKELANIQTMVKHGKTADAQREILNRLQDKFGGLADAMGDTFAGKMDILNNKFDDMKEAVGNAIIPALSKMADSLMPLIDKIMPQLSEFLEKDLTPALMDAAKQFGDWVSNIKPDDIKTFFKNLSDGAKSIGDFITNIGNATKAVGDFLNGLNPQNAAASGADIGNKFRVIGEGIVTGIKGGISENAPSILNQIKIAIDTAKAGLPEPIKAFISSGESVIDTIIAGFQAAPGKMLAALQAIVLEAIHNLSKSLRDSGGLGSGLADVIDNATKGLEPPKIPTPQLPSDSKMMGINAGQTFVGDVAQGMTSNTSATTDAMDGVTTASANAVTKKSPDAQKAGTTFVQQMGLGVTSGSSNVTTALSTTVNSGITGLTATLGQFNALGRNIIDSIVAGIMSNPGAIEGALSAIVNAAIARIKADLHIASPSKVFMNIGLTIPQGMAQGILSGAHLPQLALKGVNSGMIGTASSNVNHYRNSNSNVTNNYNFGNNIYRPEDSSTDNAMQMWRKS